MFAPELIVLFRSNVNRGTCCPMTKITSTYDFSHCTGSETLWYAEDGDAYLLSLHEKTRCDCASIESHWRHCVTKGRVRCGFTCLC